MNHGNYLRHGNSFCESERLLLCLAVWRLVGEDGDLRMSSAGGYKESPTAAMESSSDGSSGSPSWAVSGLESSCYCSRCEGDVAAATTQQQQQLQGRCYGGFRAASPPRAAEAAERRLQRRRSSDDAEAAAGAATKIATQQHRQLEWEPVGGFPDS